MAPSSSFVQYQPFSSLRCTKSFSFIGCITMTKNSGTKEERVVSKSIPALMNVSSFLATSSSAASSLIVSESPGTSGASGRPGSRMNIAASSFNAASTSQVRLKDAYLGGLMEEQRRDPSHQEEENSEDSDNPAAGTWYSTGEPVAQDNKAWGNPLHTEPVLQLTRKVERIRKPHGTTICIYRRTHRTTWKLHGQEDLWKTARRSYARFECEFGYVVNVHEYHSSSSSSSRKRR